MRSALLQVGCVSSTLRLRDSSLVLWNTGSPAFAGDDAMSVVLMLALEPADMLLGVKLEPDPPDHIELGFEEVDVVFLVLHQAFEQIARDVVLDAVAVSRRFLVKRAGTDLGGQIAFDDFLDVLADP